jgi:hypothetical protein
MNGELVAFWQDYPEGSLTSEFIGFECGKYIVSARATSDRGKIIANSLAAAETIESAEEGARQRLLAIVATRTSISSSQAKSIVIDEVSDDGGKKVEIDRSNGFSELSKSGDSIDNLANTSEIVASVGSEDISATAMIASKPLGKSLAKKGIVKEETLATIVSTPTVVESISHEGSLTEDTIEEDVSPPVTPTEMIEAEIETTAEVTPEKSGRSSPRKSKKATALANDAKIEEVPLTTDTFDLPRSSNNPIEAESESSFTPPPPVDSLPPIEESEPFSLPVDDSSIEEQSSFTSPSPIDSLPPEEESESFSPPPVDSLPPVSSPPVAESSGSGSPVNFGEVIPRLKVQLSRLGWDRDRGRDFLMERYNKRSSTLLTSEQLVDFLNYLESQPDPDLPL